MSLPKKVVKYNPIRSVIIALAGVITAFRREPNLSIQFIIGLIITILSISNQRWVAAMANLVVMGIVISLEMVNTVIEAICDLVHPQYHPKVKFIKDISAGAVLVMALVWLVIIVYQLLVIFVFQGNIYSSL